jgi:DNA-directed RNA polymerase subunit RPC12/RpoP
VDRLSNPKVYHCLRCSKSWASYQIKPLVCGKCKSPYWNIPKKLKEIIK